MEKNQFEIGKTFYTGSGPWVCTDIGTRVIVAVKKSDLDAHPHGPPFSVGEHVFDEYDVGGCSLDPDRYVDGYG